MPGFRSFFSVFLQHFLLGQISHQQHKGYITTMFSQCVVDPLILNPSAVEVIFVQCTKKQKQYEIILTLSCWYSLEHSCRVLSDEYPFGMVSVNLSFLSSFHVNLISNKRVKGALKAHIHISLYESNTLQEQDAALLFLSVIP